MKELTYKDWQKNPTPREMWVWDNFEEVKEKQKVIYISEITSSVIAIKSNDSYINFYKHCAEIKEARRMTHRELSRWLREKPTREYKYCDSDYIYNNYCYRKNCENKEVGEKVLIREDYGEWKSPVIEKEDE